MKKIIVQEFDYDKTPIDVVRNFHFNIQGALPEEDYILITTPFKIYMANPEDKLTYIQDHAYSAEELLEVIEKANMYDGLCDKGENMDEVKLLRKYIQDKTMHYKYFKKVSLEDAKNAHLTDYERGYIAGVCHAFNEVNRDLNSDNIDAEVIINKRLGRGLGWCRVR